MPEETISTAVKVALEELEDSTLENLTSKVESYNIIKNALEKKDNIDTEVINRLLAVCIRDMGTVKFITPVIKIISPILAMVKIKQYDPAPDLLPSALSLLGVTKTIALLGQVESLIELCFETLLSYPEKTLIALTDNHEEMVELFNLYCHSMIPAHTKMHACVFLHKLLKMLPAPQKRVFVERDLSIWFSKIIPTAMAFMSTSTDREKQIVCIEILELLTEELAFLNYAENPQWHNILECICNSKKYPAIMKTLLQAGNDIWCRLWIVFISLLKHQVTQPLFGVGTPINSMLPVVEAAFKLDVENRCKAFQCWNVLIDSFSTETNESNINKRIKLLIIPLKSNNAKVEETAIAKFRCWWHLIRKFQNKMDKFLDLVLVSFLQFCFGRCNASDKSVLVPGQISVKINTLCNQAIVDMLGHVNCEGCTDLPSLKGKMITTSNLVDNWNHWIFSLTSVIMKTANSDNGLTRQQMTCLWKSFLKTIGDLPQNNIRKDLFTEVLSIVSRLVEECKSDKRFLDIVFNILILGLFSENTKIEHLFNSDTDPDNPISRIVKVTLDASLHGYYKSLSNGELREKFKIITNFIIRQKVCKHSISWIIVTLPTNEFALVFWNALAESSCEIDTCKLVKQSILLWPLQYLNLFNDVRIPATTWSRLCELMYPKMDQMDLQEIYKLLRSKPNKQAGTVFFKLSVLLCALKHEFARNNCVDCEGEMKMLLELTQSMDQYNYDNFKEIFPMLVERLVAIMVFVTSNENLPLTKLTMMCVRQVLKVLTQAGTQDSHDSEIVTLLTILLKPLLGLYNTDSYKAVMLSMTENLVKLSPLLCEHSSTQNTYLSILKTLHTKLNPTDGSYNEIKTLIDNVESKKVETVDKGTEANSDKNNFPTPQTKQAPKRTKRKEPNIVNTVVENGEEYVVVKSHWKFNPRNLTENQKEKFQRKREDIPALYQDLSQSQDEFKLVSWRADSQDTTSNSKSESRSSKPDNNESATEILKNLPNTNVVPKILENFFSPNEKKDGKDPLPKDNLNKKDISTPSPKSTKSPRMALKDRVFRNVRNLIENSGLQKENKDSPQSQNKTDNNNKTPTHTKDTNAVNAVNSAPPLLSADRPSRVKRKPRKFEDLHLLGGKKARHSLQDAQSGKIEKSSTDTKSSKSNSVLKGDIVDAAETMSKNSEVNKADEAHIDNDTDMEICNNQEINNVDSNKTPTVNDEKTSRSKDKDDASTKSDIASDRTENNSKEQKSILSTPKNSKNTKNVDVSASKLSKVVKEVTTPKTPKQTTLVAKLSTPKACIPEKEVSTPIVSKEVQEVSTPKTSKDIEEVSTPKSSKDIQISTPKSSKIIKEVSVTLSTKDVKDVSTPKTSNDIKNISTPKMCKDVVESTPKSSKDVQEASTPKISKSNVISTPKVSKDVKEVAASNVPKDLKEVSTPKQAKENKELSTPKQSPKGDDQKSTVKKSTTKKSRIEKELAIDTVEGHPYLNTQSEKRVTRKALESVNTGRRKSVADKLNKSKSGGVSGQKSERKIKEKNNRDSENSSSSSIVVEESQENSEPKEQTSFSDELPYSDDVIESSQDSTMTTISVKSTRKTPKKIPVVCVEKLTTPVKKVDDINESQSILEGVKVGLQKSPPNQEMSKSIQENKDDSEFPLNKTVEQENTQDNLTENMDTEPMDDKDISDVILINEDVPAVTVSSSDSVIGPETQELAEADTQPTDPNQFTDTDITQDNIPGTTEVTADKVIENHIPESSNIGNANKSVAEDVTASEKRMGINSTANNITATLSESACVAIEQCIDLSSPFKDEVQRQQDFLNNTLEISPIKTMSPDRNKKSPSPETSSDYVVIKLTSPVHSNGEPFEKCGSPEVFTDDKVSPDKRDQSPPRVEISVTNTSPSSSLSLKKNRPQVRSGGRGAQMLGLCVPDKVQAIVNPERNETEETRKGPSMQTPARRNLRILYNSVNDNTESSNSASENDESENFLKFRRSLPAVDSSPSGPILKRKLAEITDDATVSPASKRKRVSFHDPPVSTTISVQKYIEPGGVRSPQNSAQKRLERQLRQHAPIRSPKRLDNVFKLDTVLTKAVESFAETDVIEIPDDTQPLSMDETPEVEVVRASELNDTDPICSELIDCSDPIENIAGELSSPAMKSLLIKELEGKIETVGDLAKMTELEVNRLCIKAPKVKVAKKVLMDYASKRVEKFLPEVSVTVDAVDFDEPMTESEVKGNDIECQTEVNKSMEMEVQTEEVLTSKTSTQTDVVPCAHMSIQTVESGSKSTVDIIQTCLSEKPDFVEQLHEQLEETSIRQISEKLSLNSVTDLLLKKITPSDTNVVLDTILGHNSSTSKDRTKPLNIVKNYLCERFNSKDLVLLCSQILQSAYDKPA